MTIKNSLLDILIKVKFQPSVKSLIPKLEMFTTDLIRISKSTDLVIYSRLMV